MSVLAQHQLSREGRTSRRSIKTNAQHCPVLLQKDQQRPMPRLSNRLGRGAQDGNSIKKACFGPMTRCCFELGSAFWLHSSREMPRNFWASKKSFLTRRRSNIHWGDAQVLLRRTQILEDALVKQCSGLIPRPDAQVLILRPTSAQVHIKFQRYPTPRYLVMTNEECPGLHSCFNST